VKTIQHADVCHWQVTSMYQLR